MKNNKMTQDEMLAEYIKTLIQYPKTLKAIEEVKNLAEKLFLLVGKNDTICCDSYYHEFKDIEILEDICNCLLDPSLRINIYGKGE